MRITNPYRPGFNQTPAHFAGRDPLLGDVREALEIAAYDHRTPRPLVLVGSRGVGKTVTLGEVAHLAGREFSWPTVHVETRSGAFLRDLVIRLGETTQLLAGEAPRTPKQRRSVKITGGKLTAGGFGVGGEVQLDRLEDDLEPGQVLDGALTYAMQVAIERDAGIVLTLDEIHTATTAELNELSACLQEHVPDNWPLVVAVAGLPSLRTNRGPRKLPTYLERSEWHELGPLAPEDAHHALVEPARMANRPMTPEAATKLFELCGGYPYAIQVTGHYAWRTSHGADTITIEHAHAAQPRIEQDLEQLFIGRWADASTREKEYLTAVATVAQQRPPTGGNVATHLGVTAKSLSYLRERLIKKGTLYADAEGILHFITPGMGQWIITTTPATQTSEGP